MKKCPFCAEVIQDEAIVCKHCGRDLRPGAAAARNPQPVAFPMFQQPVEKKKTSPCLIILAVVGGILLCSMTAVIYNLIMGENIVSGVETGGTQAAQPPTIRPTITPSRITMADIEHNRRNLTDIQWKDYANGLKGVRVHWIGAVKEVDNDGTVYLDADQALFHSIYIDGFPVEKVKNLNKGQVIEFEATIEDVTTFLALSIWLKSPVLISVR